MVTDCDRIGVVVKSVSDATPTIKMLTLVDVRGHDLPPFTPGAHVDVLLNSGLVRQYSLCGPVARRDSYQIAVKRIDEGRGGSREVHREVKAGDTLTISKPRNHFPLKDYSGPRVFLAGGIGITPIWPMIERLRRDGDRFFLYYSVRSRKDALFLAEIEELVKEGTAEIYVNDEVGNSLLDVDVVLARFLGDKHVYCCGPSPLMAVLQRRAATYPGVEVFFESFGASLDTVRQTVEDVSNGGRVAAEFHVLIRSTGDVVPVGPDESILLALEEYGIAVESSCRAGTCGTCMVRYIRGDVSHMDYVLSDDEKKEFIMICVSRSVGVIELDL